MKKVLALTMAVALAAGMLAGCGGTASIPAQLTPAPPAPAARPLTVAMPPPPGS